MLYSLLHTSSEINRLLLHDSCAKEHAYVISVLYQKNYRNFEVHVLTSSMKPNATSKFSDHCLFCAKYYLFLIATERSFVSRNQKPGHVATIIFYCKGGTIKFSQVLCSLDRGSDVMVRAFVSHWLELGLIPLSTHGNNFENSVC